MLQVARIDAEQRLASDDVGALLEQAAFDDAVGAGAHFRGAHRFDPAGQLDDVRNLLRPHRHRHDQRRRARSGRATGTAAGLRIDSTTAGSEREEQRGSDELAGQAMSH